MVTFASIFLWLMTNVHPVQVVVDPAVASVEIFLDGNSIGVATAPEWQVKCDFGSELAPHELVAVARDEKGEELGRTVQLVNLPRPKAAVDFVFEGGTPDQPELLRVVTESSERLRPLAIFVSFDGLALPRMADGRFRLPPYDRRQVHIISAEAHFPNALSARRDVTFGGSYGGRIATELTAVPVFLDERRELEVDDVQGLLHARGEELKVAAVDRQGARLYIVRDHGTWPALRTTGYMMDRRHAGTRRLFAREVARIFRDPENVEEIKPEHDRFYLVVPNPTRSRGLALYPIYQPFDINRWGMPWLMTHIVGPQAAVPGQQLAAAAAVAAVRAAADGTPRAVVIVLGDEVVDRSEYQPQAVREYLEALRVPVVVWTTSRHDKEGPWGEMERVDSLGSLGKASRRLLKRIRRQWIVWVEGSHMPSDIELVENNRGIRLAG